MASVYACRIRLGLLSKVRVYTMREFTREGTRIGFERSAEMGVLTYNGNGMGIGKLKLEGMQPSPPPNDIHSFNFLATF